MKILASSFSNICTHSFEQHVLNPSFPILVDNLIGLEVGRSVGSCVGVISFLRLLLFVQLEMMLVAPRTAVEPVGLSMISESLLPINQ